MRVRIFGTAVVASLVCASPARADGTAQDRLTAVGLALASTCDRVDGDALARRLVVEVGARPVRPRATLSLSCDDAGARFVLLRALGEPPVQRAFRWPVGPSDEPERWLALAIAQSLADAGVLSSRGPEPPAIVAPPPQAAARNTLGAEAGWRWFALGGGWNGPQISVDAVRAWNAWAVSLLGGGCTGVEQRELGSVRAKLVELDVALARRAWASGRSALWLEGGLGVVGVSLVGQGDPGTVVGRARGAAPAWSVSARYLRRIGSVSTGIVLRAGVIAGAPAGYVRDELPVRTSGVFTGASFVLGGGP